MSEGPQSDDKSTSEVGGTRARGRPPAQHDPVSAEEVLRAVHGTANALTTTAAAMEDRRRRVVRLHLAGMTSGQIGAALGVTARTVEKDLVYIRREVLGALSPSRIQELVADAHLVNRTVRELAFAEFHKIKPSGKDESLARAKLLETALRANIVDIRLWQDMRVFPKAPLAITADFLDHPAVKDLTPEERRNLFRGLRRALIVMGEKEAFTMDFGALGLPEDGDEIEVTGENGGEGA